MKKVIFVPVFSLFLLVGLFSVADAAWWNPASWFKQEVTPVQVNTENDELLKKVEGLEKRIQEKETNTPKDSATQKESTAPAVQEKIVTQTIKVDNPELQRRINNLMQENTTLRTQLKNVQSDYASCQARSISQTTPTVIPSLVSPSASKSSVTEKIDYGSYTKLENIRYYTKNPLPHFGKPIMLKNGLVVDLDPAVDPTSDSSYIHLVDYTGTSLDLGDVALKIDDAEDFNEITSLRLKVGDRVNIYGLGARSVEFRIVGGASGSYMAYKPVIILQRILRCMESCDESAPEFIFSK